MPESVLLQYMSSKGGKEDVSLLVLREEERISPVKDKKLTMRSMTGEVFSALGFLGKKKPDTAKKSTAISREKQRGKLFVDDEQARPTTAIGTMSDVEKLFNRE
jgi:hypothetical protein